MPIVACPPGADLLALVSDRRGDRPLDAFTCHDVEVALKGAGRHGVTRDQIYRRMRRMERAGAIRRAGEVANETGDAQVAWRVV